MPVCAQCSSITHFSVQQNVSMNRRQLACEFGIDDRGIVFRFIEERPRSQCLDVAKAARHRAAKRRLATNAPLTLIPDSLISQS